MAREAPSLFPQLRGRGTVGEKEAVQIPDQLRGHQITGVEGGEERVLEGEAEGAVQEQGDKQLFCEE